ncbi:D-alanyl-D-alanine carboxypeptidase family protein [Trebonia kvetii]|nr:serine hydrolase [Trebonia kvetii]
MRRLAARLVIAGLAFAIAGTAAGCSATPGLAYAKGVTSSRTASPASAGSSGSSASSLASPTVGAVNATVPAAEQSKTAPAGPSITVVGAPKAVKAKAGILVDATTGQVLWARNATEVRPIASITKVMTALVVMQANQPNRGIAVPKAVKNYVAKYGANAVGLIPGQVLTVDELMHMMLIESAADAAYTLANAYGPGLPAFIGKMNAEATRLGLTHTHFTSPDGLPYPSETSTYSTPAELVHLGEVAMEYPEFRGIVKLRYYTLKKGKGHGAYSVTSSNELIGQYPGVVGIKTGFTDAAGHTLLFEAVRDGRVLIGDVLGSPPTGAGAGAQDAAKVLTWAFSLKQAS